METTVGRAGIEARHAMFSVWMAISAVWIAFWLVIAGLIAALGAPPPDRFGLFAAIVLAPPLALLIIVTIGRWVFESMRRSRLG